MDALTTYKLFSVNRDSTLERIKSSPIIDRDVAYYKENIGNIKSAEDLVADRRLLNFALSAYGLEDMSFAGALIQKLLEGGVDDPDALSNQLSDQRYREFARDFNFSQFGAATTSFTTVQEGVVDKFYTQQVEVQAGDSNTGARLAIYFERKAEDITSQFGILADRALLQVVQTAFGLSPQMSLLPIDKQADLLNEQYSIDDLSDKEFIDKLMTRFLASWDINNPTVVTVPPLISSPFGQSLSISLDTIATLQRTR